MTLGTPSIKNINGPRPDWARATAKFIRGICTASALTGLGFDSKLTAVIAVIGLYVSEFILDLFPQHKGQTNNNLKND